MNSELSINSDQADAPQITAHFFISGRDFDPAAVTSVLGVDPSEVWRQERRELIARPDLPTVCWKHGFKKKPFVSIDDAVAEVLEAIWPLRDRVQQWLASNATQAGIECSVSIYNERPIYELSATTISKLSDLRCEFVLDIFDYSHDDDADE
ncbi:MAG TPA: DUF4279 domain-containing protein [Gammaproteobacteria bacterium]|nr:DUF4279 domain-containing protein [Gammaproteobacteria bacterium]